MNELDVELAKRKNDMKFKSLIAIATLALCAQGVMAEPKSRIQAQAEAEKKAQQAEAEQSAEPTTEEQESVVSYNLTSSENKAEATNTEQSNE